VVVVFHVVFHMFMMMLNMAAMFHTIMVSHMFGNMLMVMNMTAISVVTTMLFHVVLNMLVVVLNVPAVFHAMDMGMLFGMGVLNMVQLGFAVVLSTAAIQVGVVGGMVMMFHGSLLISCGGFYHRVSCPRET
jgi:hypothetical protein